MSRLTTRLYTFCFGHAVGKDAQGNRYFEKKNKRWVVYAKAAEPSSVTPEWHGWLHQTTDTLPSAHMLPRRPWQKPPHANRTGTAGAYLPPGHLLKAAHHAPTTADYEPWIPGA